MLNRDRIDLLSIDFRALSPRDREEVLCEARRRAHAERAAMMNAVFMALPRLIGRAFVRLTRKRNRPVMIPRAKILQV
jgi:hypothetical protein